MNKRLKFKAILLIILIGLTLWKYFNPQKNKIAQSTDNFIGQQIKKAAIKPLEKIRKKDIKKSHKKHDGDSIEMASNKVLKTVTDIEIKELLQNDFAKIIKQVKDLTPKKLDLKKLSHQELHHTPSLLTNFALNLAQIKRIIILRPSFFESVRKFYFECTVNLELPDTIRATCLAHLSSFLKERGEELDISTYPENIQFLVKELSQLE